MAGAVWKVDSERSAVVWRRTVLLDNIILIGLSGTGKTTTGKLLADRLGKVFIDIDIEIEQECGMSVTDIFRIHGEDFFREQERLVIQRLLHKRDTVISTGGGAVLNPDNVCDLKSCGVLVWMKAPPEVIIARIEQDHVARPLLNKPDRLLIIKKMLDDRAEKYQTADVAVETGTKTPWDVADTIIKAIQGRAS